MKKILTLGTLLLAGMCVYAQDAAAAAPVLDSGNTAWMLISTALVLLMTPAGLALFYSGLTQNKSVLNTIGMSYVAMCTGFVAWVVLGYSLSFAGTDNPWIGNFDWAMLRGITVNDLVMAPYNFPRLAEVAFQGTFAAIAVAIVSGSIIERVRFSTWVIFSVLWVIVVYSPIAHWVWGMGDLHPFGADMDFAGGTVIHINAGVAGLVVSYMLGKRIKLDEERFPSSIKLMILGSALLWFGWMGFNGGSAYAANGQAANAILVSIFAAAVSGLVWLMIEWFIIKKPTLIGLASGVVSGLVGITPAAGFVDITGALVIGVGAGIVGYLGVVVLKEKLGHDDTLDAFGMHGLVGIFGALMTGLFANPAISGVATYAGVFYGKSDQLLIQLTYTGATVLFSAVGTFVTFKIAQLLTKGGRIHEKIELEGMDIGYHGEKAIVIHDHNIQKK
jgi:ammonium transporter, Amt family